MPWQERKNAAKSTKPNCYKSPTQVVADALQRVAARLFKEWEDGERSDDISLGDLCQAFGDVAREIERE